MSYIDAQCDAVKLRPSPRQIWTNSNLVTDAGVLAPAQHYSRLVNTLKSIEITGYNDEGARKIAGTLFLIWASLGCATFRSARARAVDRTMLSSASLTPTYILMPAACLGHSQSIMPPSLHHIPASACTLLRPVGPYWTWSLHTNSIRNGMPIGNHAGEPLLNTHLATADQCDPTPGTMFMNPPTFSHTMLGAADSHGYADQ